MLTTKQMVQQQVAATLVNAFVNMLFSNNSQANAQKQRMMEELQARQAEAERQHKIAEAQRLAVICTRLSGVLKLDGLPKLEMKDVGTATGGLRLKLGDDNDGHVGIKGLPGIALNDDTGNGGSTPYGVAGLPGIYTNGPRSESGNTSASGSGLHLKLGDESTQQQATGSRPPPAPVDANLVDPQDMTPGQLADLATQLNDLPPEEQQRLMSAAQNVAKGSSPATNGAPSTLAVAYAAGQPAQLQQVADASQSAASAASLDDAAAKARIGFDQAGNGKLVTPAPSAASANITPHTGSLSSASPNASAHSAVSKTDVVSTQSSALTTAVDVARSDSERASVVQTLPTGMAGRAPGCPIDSTRRLPSREDLIQELAGLRFRLDVLKKSLMRLNRSIQMDQRQFADWQKETQDAAQRSDERLKKAIVDKVEERFFDYAEAYYKNSQEKLQAVKRVQVLLKENDVIDWADKGAKDWDQFGDGLEQLGNVLPLSRGASAVLWASKNILDSSFDIATELASWRRLSQLQNNSDSYLTAVKKSGEQMKRTVTRIRNIEDTLAAGIPKAKEVVSNVSVCE